MRAVDLGVGGCHLLAGAHRYPVGTEVTLLLRSERVRQSLVADGVVAWATATKVGVRFGRGQDGIERWFHRIVDPAPALRSQLDRFPRCVRFDDLLACAPGLRLVDVVRGPAERLVLRALVARPSATVREIAAVVACSLEVFSCALFALVDQGLVTVTPRHDRPETSGGVARLTLVKPCREDRDDVGARSAPRATERLHRNLSPHRTS